MNGGDPAAEQATDNRGAGGKAQRERRSSAWAGKSLTAAFKTPIAKARGKLFQTPAAQAGQPDGGGGARQQGTPPAPTQSVQQTEQVRTRGHDVFDA